MLGLIIGIICLVGLIAVLRRGWGPRHWGHGYGYGACNGGPWRHGRPWRRYGLYATLDELETTPGQEKEIRSALETLSSKGREVRRDLYAARGEIARALRGERLDEAALEGFFDKSQAVLRQLWQETLASVRRVHESLDERQRARLADRIEAGPRF